MSRLPTSFRTILPTSMLLLLAATNARAEQLVGPVNKAEWGTNIPAHIEMYVGVPDNLPENAPILVNIHSCGNNAGGQWGYAGFAPIRQAMESVGFLMIVPQQSQNCWDVGTTESLTHGGGGDTGAIIQMIQYVVDTYGADPSRVYAMGGSGGGMCVQALMAVYPEIFKGGHARAGVPAGCWAENYAAGNQWSDPCANGQVDKTPEEWGDYVRAINPDYTGPRPRVQLNHGDQDVAGNVIDYKNMREAIEQWTTVLGLPIEPTRTDSGFVGTATTNSGPSPVTYDREYWDDACGYPALEAWTAVGQGHSMGYESEAILEFFGLDEVRELDPWEEMCGDFGGAEPEPEPEPEGMETGAGGAGGGEMPEPELPEADPGPTGTPMPTDPVEMGMSGGMTGVGAPTGMTAATGETGAAGPTGAAMPGAAGATGTTGAGTPVGATGGAPTPVAMPGAVVPPAAGAGTTTPAAGTAPGVAPAPTGTLAGMPASTAPMSGGGGSDSGCGVVSSPTSGSSAPLALFGLGLAMLARRRRRDAR